VLSAHGPGITASTHWHALGVRRFVVDAPAGSAVRTFGVDLSPGGGVTVSKSGRRAEGILALTPNPRARLAIKSRSRSLARAW
jgi:hypothetical protein